MTPGQRRRRFWLGLKTLLGQRPQGFFIPYRYADQTPERLVRGPYPAVEALFKDHEPDFAKMIAEIDRLAEDLSAIGPDHPPQPRWNQTWFPRLDAAAAYAMVRTRQPKRLVEIGSGHSTRFFARAVKDGGLETQITAIDPQPRADLQGLPITLLRATLQDAGLAAFEGLKPGDAVSIDSSHILMPGTDVDLFHGAILPQLPAGALVHIHDILLPDGYPKAWDWRGYNEQQAVLPLLFSGGWKPLFSSHYAATRMAESLKGTVIERLPLDPKAIETGLWLIKTT